MLNAYGINAYGNLFHDTRKSLKRNLAKTATVATFPTIPDLFFSTCFTITCFVI